MSLDPDEVLIVTGLPRSGTSLMMQILFAAGVPVLVDTQRPPDQDNPRGYFELEQVKRLQRDASWLPAACGKAVKVVSPLLFFLPLHYKYKVLFMDRPLSEVIASQLAMLKGMDKSSRYDGMTEHYAALYAKHLDAVRRFIEKNDCFSVTFVSHSNMIHSPHDELNKVATFLGDEGALCNSVGVVATDLYRCRG